MKRAALTALTISTLAFAGQSIADNAPVGPQPNVIETVKNGQPMRMNYELEAKAYILFIPATGRATFNADIKDDHYFVNSRVKVTGIADWFVNYDMNLQASGYTWKDQLQTYSYKSQNRDGKKNRRVEMTIKDPNNFDMVATPRFGNLGEPAATAAQAYDAKDPISALISFALEPRAPGTDPCGGPLKIFDGRQLTHLHLKNAGTKDIRTPVWRGDAIECHVTLERVAGYDADEMENPSNLSGIDGPLRMYLAPLDNGATVPIKIVAETDKIGTVKLTAKRLSFEPIVQQNASAN